MKYGIQSLVILVCFFASSAKAFSLPGKPTAKLCNYCTEQGKVKLATNIANYVGQTIYIVDFGSQLVINEYKSMGAADRLRVEFIKAHGPTSDLALILLRAKEEIDRARIDLEHNIEGVELSNNFPWDSAFTALRAKEQVSSDIEEYFNSYQSLKQNLDILDLSLEQIKDNFGVSIGLVTINLNITQVVTVKFADGTAMIFEILLIRDISKTKSKIQIGLKLAKAIDRESKPIPTSLFSLGRFKVGTALTEGNTGNLNAFLGYAASLGEIRIIIDNRTEIPEGQVVITDCKIKEGQDGVEIVCNSQNG